MECKLQHLLKVNSRLKALLWMPQESVVFARPGEKEGQSA